MKKSFKFKVAMFVVLTSLLSGCYFPGYGWDHDGGRGGDRGGEHGDRGGDRGGDHGDHR
jgi:hypothetical protein